MVSKQFTAPRYGYQLAAAGSQFRDKLTPVARLAGPGAYQERFSVRKRALRPRADETNKSKQEKAMLRY